MKEKNQKSIGVLLSFMAIGAFWRRWFGGGFKKYLPDSRFWKYLALIIVCFTMYWIADPYFTFWKEIRTYATTAAFAYHWARSHGDYYCIWDTSRDEGRIKWIDCILRLLYGKDGYYNFKGNVTGLFLRYTSTACIAALCLPNAWFVVSGILTTLAYIVTGKMERPTEKAEWLAGALNFGMLYLCIGG